MKYKGYLYAEIGGKFFKISHTSQFEELKRLQKEIDEAEKERTEIIMSSWGLDNPNNNERNFELIDLITEKQLKIKQIIESL